MNDRECLRTSTNVWRSLCDHCELMANCESRSRVTINYSIIIIIIRHLLCPVVGRRPQHAGSKLPCLVQSSARSCRSSICPGRLSTAWLVSLVVLSCHYGLQVVTRVVHRSSLRRLICPAQDHFIFLKLLIMSMTI